MLSTLSSTFIAQAANQILSPDFQCQQAFHSNCAGPVTLPGLDKFVASFTRYPQGNISYLYELDKTDWFFITLYFGILGILALYGIYRARLIYLFSQYEKHEPQLKSCFIKLPRVTVQLPLYNEMYVVERLIEAVCKLDYPRELIDIQVLDDSTDETQAIARKLVDFYRNEGHRIFYIHRENRHGFKAGALDEGLKSAEGEFVAVFDADFIPRPDTLMKMIHHFSQDKVGMVQMRWSHLNKDYSLLTKIQAIMLDGHFVIEQTSRNRSGGFFNFNGTAGMWRRSAIEHSGGWQHDTLTEDTDLSYRAQLMGWKFVYLLNDDVPAELPVEINAFKTQQRRWAKGLVQVGIKLLPRIWQNPHLPLKVKVEMFFRLTGNIAAPLMIILSILQLPILVVRYNQGFFHLIVFDVPLLLFSTISVVMFYASCQRYLYPDTWKKQLKYLPLVMAMGIGLVFSNAKAVLEAVLGIDTAFARTPKYNVAAKRDAWQSAARKYHRRRGWLPFLELGLSFYFVLAIYYALSRGIYGTVPFLMLFLIGYGYTGVMSLFQELWQKIFSQPSQQPATEQV
ncbi:MAG TPA: cellulose synthase family protein [Blastocatellia bacterium]|nr:cellulose synthase family protein [Blastocatellia bacterium]